MYAIRNSSPNDLFNNFKDELVGYKISNPPSYNICLCDDCSGSGRVIAEYKYYHEEEIPIYKECETCLGSGRLTVLNITMYQPFSEYKNDDE